MVTQAEIQRLEAASPQQLEQARSLIFRGKQFAAAGDPNLRSIINALSALGVQSARSQQIQREAIARQERQQLQTLARPEDLAQQSFAAPVQTRIPTPFTPIPTPTITPSARTLVSQQVEPVMDFGDIREQTRIDIEPVRDFGDIREQTRIIPSSFITPLPAREISPIQMRSLEPQISVGRPSVVGLPLTPTEQALQLGREEREPIPRFDLGLIRQAGREFFFQGGTPITAFGTLVAPLQTFFPQTRGEIEFSIPQFGTISTEQPTGFEVTTGIEIQRERALVDPLLLLPTEVLVSRAGERISGELVSELQPQVTAGGLSLEEAEKEFEKQFGERFEAEITPSIARRQEFITEFETGRRPVVDVARVGEFAAIGLGSLTPTGQALIGASFVAEGLPKVTGGETLLERGLGLAEIGLGIFGGGLVTKGIERSADVLLVRELQAQQALLTGREVARGEAGSLFDIRTLRQFGDEGLLKTQIRSPVFRTGEDTFSLTGGRGERTLEFFSFERGRPVSFVEEFQFGGRQRISPKPPKVIRDGLTIELEDVTGAFGTGFVQRRGAETFREFRFGGISKEIETELGKFTQIQSGRVSGLRLEGIEPLARGGITFRGGVVRAPVEEAGVIRRLSITEGTGVEFISPAKIKRTPFQTTFQEVKIPAPTGLITGIERQITFELPKVSPQVSRSLIGLPRAVDGAGLTQEQIQRGQGLVQQEFLEPLKLPPVSRQDLGVGLVQPQFIEPQLIQRGTQRDTFSIGALDRLIQEDVTRPLTRVRQIPETRLAEALDIKQLQKQFQATEQQLGTQLGPPSTITPFDPFGRFDFGVPFIPPFFPLPKERQGPRIRRRGKRVRTRIAPSFTGIVLGIETAALIDPIFGVLPGQIRGLATGFDVPTRRRKKAKKKKVTKKKVSKKKKKKKR